MDMKFLDLAVRH